MANRAIVPLLLLLGSCATYAQTSIANGSWTTGSTWSGGSVPSGWTTIDVGHTISKSSDHTVDGTLNVNSSGILTLNGNVTVSGGSTINVYGRLIITGSLTLYSNFNVYPGGAVVVNGSTTVVNSTYLNIGTSSTPTQESHYSNMVIKQNLVSQSSGDITVNRNGRLAVYGNMTNDTSGDTILTINQGGQAYIHGNMTLVGGGDDIVNNNSVEPYGLYVNGTVSANTSNGATIDSNVGDQQDMYDGNSNFANWVAAQESSPLPVELLYFTGKQSGGEISLKWATASQLNFDYFSIEYSTDGIVWKEINKVQGEGTTYELMTYEIATVDFIDGRNYYRLKSIDFDLSYEYSEAVVVHAVKDRDFSVFPNPSVSGDKISFELNFAPQDGDVAIVVDYVGNIIARVSVSDLKGDFAVPHLKEGVYHIRYEGVGYKSTTRLLVQ